MSGKDDKPEINNTMPKYWYVAHISKQPELNTSYIFFTYSQKREVRIGIVTGAWSDMHRHCGHFVLALLKQMIVK